uniref:Uncharacterized protein n=1 Tax=Mycena chlorophos TaxID=658473 RepID=A0ABQ0LNC8_MYCCL|nr:predicted protein [Mycena chlorophos]
MRERRKASHVRLRLVANGHERHRLVLLEQLPRGQWLATARTRPRSRRSTPLVSSQVHWDTAIPASAVVACCPHHCLHHGQGSLSSSARAVPLSSSRTARPRDRPFRRYPGRVAFAVLHWLRGRRCTRSASEASRRHRRPIRLRGRKCVFATACEVVWDTAAPAVPYHRHLLAKPLRPSSSLPGLWHPYSTPQSYRRQPRVAHPHRSALPSDATTTLPAVGVADTNRQNVKMPRATSLVRLGRCTAERPSETEA